MGLWFLVLTVAGPDRLATSRGLDGMTDPRCDQPDRGTGQTPPFLANLQEVHQPGAERIVSQAADKLSVHGERDRAGLLGDDDHDRVALLRHPERRFMASMNRRVYART